MVGSCAAYNCTERFIKGSGISFHKFPADAVLREKWVLALKRKKFKVSSSSTICSRHFRKADYKIYDGKKRLKVDAVPTVFDDVTERGAYKKCGGIKARAQKLKIKQEFPEMQTSFEGHSQSKENETGRDAEAEAFTTAILKRLLNYIGKR